MRVGARAEHIQFRALGCISIKIFGLCAATIPAAQHVMGSVGSEGCFLLAIGAAKKKWVSVPRTYTVQSTESNQRTVVGTWE